MTAVMIASGCHAERRLERAVAAAVLVGRELPGLLGVPDVGEDRGEGVDVVSHPSCPLPAWPSRSRRGRCRPASTAPCLVSAVPLPMAFGASSGSGAVQLVLAGQREPDQRRVAGAGPLVDAAVGVAGQHPLGLLPRADARPAGGGDLLALAQVVDELHRRGRRHVVHELPVDHHHRRVVAGRVALDVLEGDLAVLGGLVVADVEVVLEPLEDRVAAHHRAQRVGADADEVVADRLALVHRVERRDAADLGGRDVEDGGAGLDPLGRDPPLDRLHEVQHRQQATAGLGVARGDLARARRTSPG